VMSPLYEKHGCWILTTTDIITAVSTTNVDWGAPDPRHNEMSNVAFLDGHVKAMKPSWYPPSYALARALNRRELSGYCTDVRG